MNRRFLSSLLGVGVACLLGAGVVLPDAALSAELKKPFSYFANGHELRTVLTGFAKAQGLSAVFDGDSVKGKVSGRFQKVAPKDFLLAMSEAYEVGYYVLGETIHFYPASAVKKEFLTVPAGSAKSLVDSLKRSGFIASELPVSVNAEGIMLTMNGPEAYLTSIRAAADAYLAVQSEKIEMRVFPIRHAWADDIELSTMDRTVTVPGIASILRGMVLGQSVGGTTVTKSSACQPAGQQQLAASHRALRNRLSALLHALSDHLDAHPSDYPEYAPEKNVLHRVLIAGGLVLKP